MIYKLSAIFTKQSHSGLEVSYTESPSLLHLCFLNLSQAMHIWHVAKIKSMVGIKWFRNSTCVWWIENPTRFIFCYLWYNNMHPLSFPSSSSHNHRRFSLSPPALTSPLSLYFPVALSLQFWPYLLYTDPLISCQNHLSSVHL